MAVLIVDAGSMLNTIEAAIVICELFQSHRYED